MTCASRAVACLVGSVFQFFFSGHGLFGRQNSRHNELLVRNPGRGVASLPVGPHARASLLTRGGEIVGELLMHWVSKVSLWAHRLLCAKKKIMDGRAHGVLCGGRYGSSFE